MSSRRRLSGMLEELVTSLAREEEEEQEEEEEEEQEGHGGEEWNLFEENMLVAAMSKDALAPGTNLAHWVVCQSPTPMTALSTQGYTQFCRSQLGPSL